VGRIAKARVRADGRARGSSMSTQAIVIGNFDGVHRGHQHLFRIAKMAAQGGASALLIFPPAPFTLGQNQAMALAHFKRIQFFHGTHFKLRQTLTHQFIHTQMVYETTG
jgi:FAD synthase